jgi:tRNA (guanine37-N1)-methyltransferase
VFRVFILSLFPDESQHYFLKGIFKRALDQGTFSISFRDIRDYAQNRHRKVDDYPYGDRDGMLMRVDVLSRALADIPDISSYELIYTCPKGPVMTQSRARQLSKSAGMVIIPGYYKGIDERLFTLWPIQRISMGNFVLSSGEVPAFAIAESVIRLLPGVIGNPDSMGDDTLFNGYVSCPQYTVPQTYQGVQVPEVVVSGDHQRRQEWTRQMMLRQTLFEKPHLLAGATLSEKDQHRMKALILSDPTELPKP